MSRYTLWVTYIGEYSYLNPHEIGDEPGFFLKKNALKRAAYMNRFHKGMSSILRKAPTSKIYVKDRKGNVVK